MASAWQQQSTSGNPWERAKTIKENVSATSTISLTNPAEVVLPPPRSGLIRIPLPPPRSRKAEREKVVQNVPAQPPIQSLMRTEIRPSFSKSSVNFSVKANVAMEHRTSTTNAPPETIPKPLMRIPLPPPRNRQEAEKKMKRTIQEQPPAQPISSSAANSSLLETCQKLIDDFAHNMSASTSNIQSTELQQIAPSIQSVGTRSFLSAPTMHEGVFIDLKEKTQSDTNSEMHAKTANVLNDLAAQPQPEILDLLVDEETQGEESVSPIVVRSREKDQEVPGSTDVVPPKILTEIPMSTTDPTPWHLKKKLEWQETETDQPKMDPLLRSLGSEPITPMNSSEKAKTFKEGNQSQKSAHAQPTPTTSSENAQPQETETNHNQNILNKGVASMLSHIQTSANTQPKKSLYEEVMSKNDQPESKTNPEAKAGSETTPSNEEIPESQQQLFDEYAVFPKNVITFNGAHNFLSMIYKSTFSVDGKYYDSVEHFYQVTKVRELLGDSYAHSLQYIDEPATIRKETHRILSMHKIKKEVSDDWKRKHGALVLYTGAWNKFRQNPSLAEQLLATGRKLLVNVFRGDDILSTGCENEGFWEWIKANTKNGIKIPCDCLPSDKFPIVGHGHNIMGVVNMWVRKQLPTVAPVLNSSVSTFSSFPRFSMHSEVMPPKRAALGYDSLEYMANYKRKSWEDPWRTSIEYFRR